MKKPLFEKWGVIFAIALFIISFAIIYANATEILSSLTAAFLTSLLGWVSFVMVRLTILAMRK